MIPCCWKYVAPRRTDSLDLKREDIKDVGKREGEEKPGYCLCDDCPFELATLYRYNTPIPR